MWFSTPRTGKRKTTATWIRLGLVVVALASAVAAQVENGGVNGGVGASKSSSLSESVSC